MTNKETYNDENTTAFLSSMTCDGKEKEKEGMSEEVNEKKNKTK